MNEPVKHVLIEQHRLAVELRHQSISVSVHRTAEETGEWEGEPDMGISIPIHALDAFIQALVESKRKYDLDVEERRRRFVAAKDRVFETHGEMLAELADK